MYQHQAKSKCGLCHCQRWAVIGQGHPPAGQPHAEVFALRQAGEHAQGATAYVTLEPCAHYGRTPPCAEALVRESEKVVIACLDPNPLVAGKGTNFKKQALRNRW
jgi:diaminohydroxyphosphoribosylaminopyrimidine deaminase/5-amino-6-(5-phosphoribosylamino)uracil reductase